jgi:hypothetical protein
MEDEAQVNLLRHQAQNSDKMESAGVLCVSNKPYYWLNFSFTSNLHAGNSAVFNYSVQDNTNGTTLVPITSINTTNLDVIKSYRIPATCCN